MDLREMHLALTRLETHARRQGFETAPCLLAAARCEIADAIRDRGLDGDASGPPIVLAHHQQPSSG